MIRFVFAVLLLTTPALADEPPAPKPAAEAETLSVQAWGRKHSDCMEWTDACIVCTQAGCSTPGIACAPKEIVCRRP